MLDLIVGLYSQREKDFGREEQLFLKLKLVPLGFWKSVTAVCSGVLWGYVLCHMSLLQINQPNDIDLMQFCTFSVVLLLLMFYQFVLNMEKSACICSNI